MIRTFITGAGGGIGQGIIKSLRLIKDLDEHAEGIFTVTECTFNRSGTTLIESRDATNIRADCELQWLNIRMGDGTEIKLS